MPTYETASDDAEKILKGVIAAYHGDLEEAGVTFRLLFAHAKRDEDSGEPKGPAIRQAGVKVPGRVRITSHEQRVAGLPDVVLTLDGDEWPDWGEEKQAAVIDHYVSYLELVRDEGGAVKTDDCFRPKLRKREPDWQCAGFDSVVERHKEAAVETEFFKDVNRRFHQMLFPWG